MSKTNSPAAKPNVEKRSSTKRFHNDMKRAVGGGLRRPATKPQKKPATKAKS